MSYEFTCPECGKPDIHIVESRPTTRNRRRRRYECDRCGKRYTTYEYISTDIAKGFDEKEVEDVIRQDERRRAYEIIREYYQK